MNLIITCPRNLEEETKKEVEKNLESFGDEDPVVTITSMRGILTAQTNLEPVLAVKSFKKIIEDEPWAIRYCLRIIPIQTITESESDKIVEQVQKLIKLKNPEGSFRITLEKRNSSISSNELISKIATGIPNKVSLENPDWVILVEILGGKTGISVLDNDSVLSVTRAKRALSE